MSETEASENTDVVRRRAFSNPFLAMARVLCIVVSTTIDYITTQTRLRGTDEAEALAVANDGVATWARHCLRWMGIAVRVEGAMPEGPVLLCPNHSGYVDVFALGATCRTFFVAKADVESWPAVGAMFKAGHNLSIPREQRSALVKVNEVVGERLLQGYPVCVFLEGTSCGNDRVLPFHASLVQSAIDTGVSVVPVGIRWSSSRAHVDIADDVAYWKDHTLALHLFRLLGLRGIEVTISIGDAISCEGRTRKELAGLVREQVAVLSGLPL